MVIYFLRHASAGQPFDSPGKDEKRGLDQEGIAQCGFIGRFLAAADVQVEAIVSSPLKRAAQTAFLVGNEMGFDGKIQMEAALRPSILYGTFVGLPLSPVSNRQRIQLGMFFKNAGTSGKGSMNSAAGSIATESNTSLTILLAST